MGRTARKIRRHSPLEQKHGPIATNHPFGQIVESATELKNGKLGVDTGSVSVDPRAGACAACLRPAGDGERNQDMAQPAALNLSELGAPTFAPPDRLNLCLGTPAAPAPVPDLPILARLPNLNTRTMHATSPPPAAPPVMAAPHVAVAAAPVAPEAKKRPTTEPAAQSTATSAAAAAAASTATAIATLSRRLVSQSWSRGVLLGGGVLLVAAALWPMFGGSQKSPVPANSDDPLWQPARSSVAQPALPNLQTPYVAPSATTQQLLEPAAHRLPAFPPVDSRMPAVYTAPVDLSSVRTGANVPMALNESPNPIIYQQTTPLADRQMQPPPDAVPFGEELLPPGMARLEGIIEKPSLRTTLAPPAPHR
jgi:hypothetical protein